MQRSLTLLAALTAVAYMFTFSTFTTPAHDVPYPEGFRKWTHVKTGFIGPKSPSYNYNGGFHHIYANDLAVQGLSGGTFPEGSVLVFDVIEGVDAETNIVEGKRKFIDVMVKDSAKFRDTGGWGYEEFNADSKTERRLDVSAQAKCYTCHTKQNDFVFSDLRN